MIRDFNTVLDTKKDRYKSQPNHENSLKVIKGFMNSHSLVDVWRIRNEDKLQFSWRRNSGDQIQASWVDYGLVSRGLESSIECTEYIPVYKTDHQAFYMSMNLTGKERGPSYWKFNNSLLREKPYVDMINKLLPELLEKYGTWHPFQAWEKIKTEIQRETKSYCDVIYMYAYVENQFNVVKI